MGFSSNAFGTGRMSAIDRAAAESLLVRYDPRNLSRVYVLTPSKGYQAVPYADVRRPPITLAELRFAHAELRKEAKGSINEEQLFAMHDRQMPSSPTRQKRPKRLGDARSHGSGGPQQPRAQSARLTTAKT